MRSVLNRRNLFGMMAWFLPSLAMAELLAQQPTPGKSEFKPVGEPFLGGFLKGNDFRQLSEAEETAYLMGIWDGYLFAPQLGGKAWNDKILSDCLSGLLADQLLAIVIKYMNDHPENWGKSMNWIVYAALPKNCHVDTHP